MIERRWFVRTAVLMATLALAGCAKDDAAQMAPERERPNRPGKKPMGDTDDDAAARPSPRPVPDAGRTPAPDAGNPDAGDGLPPPIDGSLQSILEIIQSESYREWTAETEEPRERSTGVSPHGHVRVFANERLLASIAKGNGVEPDPDDPGKLMTDVTTAHDTGSMVIKEMYLGEERIARAAMVKLEGIQSQVAYYCEGDPLRCGTREAPPIYGVGLSVGCGACHGGMVFTVNFPSE